MKFAKNKSVLGIIIFAAFVVVGAQYQNCAPAGSSNAFVLGSASPASTTSGSPLPTSGGGTSGSLSVSAVALSSTTPAVGAAMSASATITGGGTTDTCNWTLFNASSAVVATYMTTSASGICSLSFTAPATASTFQLNLDVVTSTSTNVTAYASFSTQSSTAPVSFSVTLNPSPLSMVEAENPFTFSAAVVSSTPQIFTVVIGTVSSGTKTPITGCSFTSTAPSTSYTPTCSAYLAIIGTIPLYVDVTVSGQTLDCQAVTTGCGGTYSVVSRVGSGGGNR